MLGGGSGLPGIVQLHGGGQRAMARTVGYWASQGYAALAVNWGEKVIGEEVDLNTDWAGIAAGFVEPTHHNEVTLGEGTWHSEAHPWNRSWLLYAAAARHDGGGVGGGRLAWVYGAEDEAVCGVGRVGGSGDAGGAVGGGPVRDGGRGSP